MITELDRYQGVVLRQLLVAQGRSVNVGVADRFGRVDAFQIEGAAFQIRYSSRRLSPWRFTYVPENLAELSMSFNPVWMFLVCGMDGVVGISQCDLSTIAEAGDGGAAWVRASRERNSMYRIGGALGELPRATRRGVEEFLAQTCTLTRYGRAESRKAD